MSNGLNSFKLMNVLIIGAEGFIGKNLYQRLKTLENTNYLKL